MEQDLRARDHKPAGEQGIATVTTRVGDAGEVDAAARGAAQAAARGADRRTVGVTGKVRAKARAKAKAKAKAKVKVKVKAEARAGAKAEAWDKDAPPMTRYRRPRRRRT